MSFLALPCYANRVDIAVASNFMVPMTSLAAMFEKQTSYQLRISYSSSGKVFTKVIHGAPYDIFLSADEDKPRRLIELGLAEESSRITYAIGAIALLSDTVNFGENGAEFLARGQFGRVALANPRFAPYGVAAMEVIDRLGLAEKLRSKTVLGDNISQVFQFVSSESVDVGFVALSQVIANQYAAGGNLWVIPQTFYTPIKQDAVQLKGAKNPTAARRFLGFLQSCEAFEVLRSYGYQAGSLSAECHGT